MPNYTFCGLDMDPVSSFKEAMEKYQMNFSPQIIPLKYDLPDGTQKISPYHRQVIHNKTLAPIWVVGLVYTTADYPIAFNLIEPLVEQGNVKIIGGGCPNRGERAYLLLDSQEEIELSSGDKIINRFFLSSSHDGQGKIEVRMAPWRNLTGTSITFDATSPLSFKHTRNVHSKLSRARNVFSSVTDRWNEFSLGVKKMVAVRLTDREAIAFIENILPSTKKEASVRLENIRDEILTLYQSTGIGTQLPQCKETLFGLVQAVAEWTDIKRTVRKSRKKDEISAALEAKLISDSAKKKQRAWAMAMYLAKQKQLSGALSK